MLFVPSWVFLGMKTKKLSKIKTINEKQIFFFRYELDFVRERFRVGYKYQQQWIEIFKNFIKFIFVNRLLSTTLKNSTVQ